MFKKTTTRQLKVLQNLTAYNQSYLLIYRLNANVHAINVLNCVNVFAFE